MAWQGRLPSSLAFIREEPPDGGFLTFNFLATSQWGEGERTVSRQDFLYDTWLAQSRVCARSSLTTPNKRATQNSPLLDFSSLHGEKGGEREVMGRSERSSEKVQQLP